MGGKLSIIADLSEEASPAVNLWLANNPFPDRLVLVNKPQDDTALLLPDIAITGPLNMRYDKEFVCNVSTIPSEVSDLWSVYSKLAKKRTARKKTTETTSEKETKNVAVSADTKYVASSSSTVVEQEETTTPISDSSTQQTTSEESL